MLQDVTGKQDSLPIDGRNQDLVIMVINPCPLIKHTAPNNPTKGRGKEAHGQQNHEDCEAALKTIGWCDVVGRRCELSPAKTATIMVMMMVIIIIENVWGYFIIIIIKHGENSHQIEARNTVMGCIPGRLGTLWYAFGCCYGWNDHWFSKTTWQQPLVNHVLSLKLRVPENSWY